MLMPGHSSPPWQQSETLSHQKKKKKILDSTLAEKKLIKQINAGKQVEGRNESINNIIFLII